MKAEPRNAEHRLRLAIVLEAFADTAGAAEQLTVALRLDPAMTAASRRLCWLLVDKVLPHNTRPDHIGLQAALAHDSADRDLLSAAVVHHLSQTAPLRSALDRARRRGWPEAARDLCCRTTGEALRSPLLLAVLRYGVISNPDVERLLTAVRRALLLDVPSSRFDDAALSTFAVMLAQQGWLNEFAWAQSPEETIVLAAQQLGLDVDAALRGEPDACRALLLCSLYCQPRAILSFDIDADALAKIQPAALRDAVQQRVSEDQDLRARAARIPHAGAVIDATSHNVAAQYDASPYPRWTSLLRHRDGEFLKKLAGVFEPRQLAFAERPFEVLIAGCGTGRQAVSAALDYGLNARITAVDIAASSLAYASRMADRMGAGNVSFLRVDIGQLDALEPSAAGRFHVIECVGVLHHMADPASGLRALTRCLAPGGIMLIGLYSAIARRNLAVLKQDPAYPGPGCDEAALRRYRQHVMALPHTAPGAEFRRGLDFASASGFRDFFLHVSETSFALPGIARLLDAHDLDFHGFYDIGIEVLQRYYPGEPWPGSLAHWAECEERHPNLFASMYQFWCTPRA